MRRKKTTLLVLLLLVSIIGAQGQTTTPVNPDAINFPQWVRDVRRAEIVAFGSFPFAMFVSSFLMDMHRWRVESGLDFSDEGRRYAPWPLKSAGGQAGSTGMTSDEAGQVVALAAGISVAVAIADQIIVQVRRNRERRRAEALPVGSVTIMQTPWGTPEEELIDVTDDDNDSVDDTDS